MTFTYDNNGPIRKVIAAWTSDDTSGAVSGTCAQISGKLVKCVTDPGAAAPSDNYDIAITDPEGLDVLANCTNSLANRDTANTEQVDLELSDGAASIAAYPVVCDALTFAVTNAGNSKNGQIILYHSAA